MIRLPAPKQDVLDRAPEIVAGLRALLPENGVISEPLRLSPYETDGLAAYKQPPMAVVLPEKPIAVSATILPAFGPASSRRRRVIRAPISFNLSLPSTLSASGSKTVSSSAT